MPIQISPCGRDDSTPRHLKRSCRIRNVLSFAPVEIPNILHMSPLDDYIDVPIASINENSGV